MLLKKRDKHTPATELAEGVRDRKMQSASKYTSNLLKLIVNT